jgi:hypothetical protein
VSVNANALALYELSARMQTVLDITYSYGSTR